MLATAKLLRVQLIAVCLAFPIISCTGRVKLNDCAQSMTDAYEIEQRKIVLDTRRKDLPAIDSFYMASNGGTPSKARLYFRSGGSRSPKMWVLDYTCKPLDQSQRSITSLQR